MLILLVWRRCVKLLLCLFLFLPAACQRPAPIPSDTLVVGLEASPTTLDPRYAVDAYSSKISRLVYRGLTRVNERMEVVADLAVEIRLEPPVTYKVVLNEGVRFHDGKPLSARDVAWTLESVRSPESTSPHRATFEKIAAIRETGELSLTITLTEPFSPFLAALTLGVLPEGTPPEAFSGAIPPGTGPFRVTEFRPSERIELERFDEAFGGAARMRRVVFRVIPDDNLRVLELMNGRLDLLQNNVPPLLIARLLKEENLTVTRTEGINVSYLGFNLHEPPLNDLRVRQAIAHALERDAIIDFRLAGLARPATGLLAPTHWAYERDIRRIPYDPEKAKSLLDEAGYPDPDGGGPAARFSLTYKTSAKKDRIGLARLIARYLKNVGIEVRVLPYEWGTFFQDVNRGNFQLFSLTWVGISDPDIFFHVFHSAQIPPDGANRGGYSNRTIDRLVQEGRKVADPEARRSLYSLAQQVLAHDLPYIFLWYEDNVAVSNRAVQGLRLRPDASFEWASEVWK